MRLTPAVHEKTDRHGERSPYHWQQAIFWFQLPAGGFSKEHLVWEHSEDNQANDITNAEAKVDKSSDPNFEMIIFSKYDREGCEEKVHITVYHRHEKRKKEDYGWED